MVGICFHVGSGCMDPPVFQRAIETCRELFDYAASIGFVFSLLDIGGGFPGHKDIILLKVSLLCSFSFKQTNYFEILFVF